MTWFMIVSTILQLLGPVVLPQLLEWLKQLLGYTAYELSGTTTQASPLVYDSEQGIEVLFNEAYARMSWIDWMMGKGFILMRIKKLMMNRSYQIWTYTQNPEGHIPQPITEEEARSITG